MKKEILNLEYHNLRILIKALSQYHSFKEASKITGVSVTALHRLAQRNGLVHRKQPDGTLKILEVPKFVYRDVEGKKELEIPIK